MKFFTDNMVVAYPLPQPEDHHGEPQLALSTIFTTFSLVQIILARYGFFLRGAIAIGQHFQDDDIVYGDAFLEAEGLDRSGEPPRLVIAPSLEPLILEELEHPSGCCFLRRWLLEDPQDHRIYLNYLRGACPEFPPEFHSGTFAVHWAWVSYYLQKYRSDRSVWQKYEWIAGYHNYVCTSLAEEYSPGEPDWPVSDRSHNSGSRRSLLKYLVSNDRLPPPQQLDADRLRQRLSKS